MREISFVQRLKFKFNGSVAKNALVIGDADNDQHNELVCANLQGDLAVFKDKNSDNFAYADGLGMVTACVIGDVINGGKNYVAAINTEGWLFIFDVDSQVNKLNKSPTVIENSSLLDFYGGETNNSSRECASCSTSGIKLTALYDQRMPANCKELLLADLDGDGQNEVIVGLTDRVLRTYKWIKIGPERGKFVGLYKWEFADQIGAVSLNPSCHENCQDIIVAQPGGTYAKLECFDKKPTIISNSTSNSSNEQKQTITEEAPQQNFIEDPSDGDNVRTEYISKLTPEYHQLALAQMRNHHISTEVLGGIRDAKESASYSLIVIATLDGTLMLVNKDEILWSLQVDHQLFALAILEYSNHNKSRAAATSGGSRDTLIYPKLSQSESTCTIIPNPSQSSAKIDQLYEDGYVEPPNKQRKISQYFVVCAWNGKTYIIDEERNYLRFKFDEAVSAFTAGIYHFDGEDHASLVYATFNNQIVLYFDVILDQIRPMYLLDEVMSNSDNIELLKQLEVLARRTGYIPREDDLYSNPDESTKYEQQTRPESVTVRKGLQELLHDLLYNLREEDLFNE